MKKSVRIKIRMYKWHDLDLISLYKESDFDFLNAMKMAARAYINNEPIFFRRPPYKGSEDYKKTYQAYLYLDSERDADIISFIEDTDSGLVYGGKNLFFKMCLRGCLIGTMAHDLLKSEVHSISYDAAIEKALAEPVEILDWSLLKRTSKAKKAKKLKEEKSITIQTPPLDEEQESFSKTNEPTVTISECAASKSNISTDFTTIETVSPTAANTLAKENKELSQVSHISKAIDDKTVSSDNIIEESPDDDFDLCSMMENIMGSF